MMLLEKLLWIGILLIFILIILKLIFKKEEVETKFCPKCGSPVEDRFNKFGDIGFGIHPMVSYKRCRKCGWTN